MNDIQHKKIAMSKSWLGKIAFSAKVIYRLKILKKRVEKCHENSWLGTYNTMAQKYGHQLCIGAA